MASEPDLSACDREPIHIPQSIQPYGLMLVVDRDLLMILCAAGDVEGRLGVSEWRGATLGSVIGDDLASAAGRSGESGGAAGYLGRLTTPAGELLDVSVQLLGGLIIVELEPGSAAGNSAAAVLAILEAAGASFQRAASLRDLCDRAAREFQRITGFDRVMVYRFLDSEAGSVLAEARAEDIPSFLNHHFPASDIPRQARALYVRNRVRVIPDVGYTPAPLRPAGALAGPLDMSDCVLRSVSPVHIQYLKNMGVAASASVSIVIDGELWGLIACHHREPRRLSYDVRAACRTLAAGLARAIKSREEGETYRERVRLRLLEDEVHDLLRQAPELDLALPQHLNLTRQLLAADSFAIVSRRGVRCAGECPGEAHLIEIAEWVKSRAEGAPFVTHRLGLEHPPAKAFAGLASGLIGVTVPDEAGAMVLLWFRAERVQVVEWAGNPHKSVQTGPQGQLNPRSSFEAWSEAVRGEAEPWSLAEVETANRVRAGLLELRQQRRLRELNAQLGAAVAEQERLLGQKEVLLREMNHRVQNSLSLVGAFLTLQARASDSAELQVALDEANRRIGAVAMAHRRLYRADQIETIDMARYIEDLWADLAGSLGPEWAQNMRLSLAPVLLPTDRAVALGLVLTELIINANKYAYGGAPGPLSVSLEEAGGQLQLVVADRGRGRGAAVSGFGSRMMQGLINQLSGKLDYQDNDPGLRAVVTAPAS